MRKVVPQSSFTCNPTTTTPSYPTTSRPYSQLHHRHPHTHSVLHSHQVVSPSHLMRRPPGLTTASNTSSADSSPHMDEHRQQQQQHHSLSLSPSLQMQYPINHHHHHHQQQQQQHVPHDQHHHAQQQNHHAYSGHMPVNPTQVTAPISPGASMNMLSISGTSTSGQSLSTARCVTMTGFASPLGSSSSSSHSTGSYVPRSPTDQLQDGYPQSANNSSYTDASVNAEGGYASASLFYFYFVSGLSP
jgi:hypothetical protein